MIGSYFINTCLNTKYLNDTTDNNSKMTDLKTENKIVQPHKIVLYYSIVLHFGARILQKHNISLYDDLSIIFSSLTFPYILYDKKISFHPNAHSEILNWKLNTHKQNKKTIKLFLPTFQCRKHIVIFWPNSPSHCNTSRPK